MVINFDLPESLDVYIHRIGRTGRAGKEGLAVSYFCGSRDAKISKHLVKHLEKSGELVPFFLTLAVQNPTQ
jgi:superfamily II DNA/RNA helicase